MRVWVLVSICLVAFRLSAEPVRLGGALHLGVNRVGFEERQTGDLKVSIWYPARSAGAPLHFGDYLGPARQELERFLSGAGLSHEAVLAYMSSPMAATRGAGPLERKFPLVLVAQGNAHGAADQAVLSEYLASHGFIVATTPSPMLRRPMNDVQQIGEFAELEAAELWKAVRVVSIHHAVDLSRIGVVGHSFGSRAALLIAMNHEQVRAVVSLDGGIGSSIGVLQMRSAPSFKVEHTPPILHLYETQDAFVQSDLLFLGSVRSESLHTERIRGMHHAHFSTLGFAAVAIPEIATLTHADEAIGENTVYVAQQILTFLCRWLRVTCTGAR